MDDICKDEFERAPLRARSFLAGIPLRSSYRMDLPGGLEGMKLLEINEMTGFGSN